MQNTYSAIDPLGEAKVDWKIILNLAKLRGVELPYSKLSEINQHMAADKMCTTGVLYSVCVKCVYIGR